MTETEKESTDQKCDECKDEIPFSDKENGNVCPSCASEISIEEMTQVRDESDNADRVPDDSDHTETDISTEQVDGQSVRVIYYTADKTGFSYYTNDSAYESKHSIYDF